MTNKNYGVRAIQFIGYEGSEEYAKDCLICMKGWEGYLGGDYFLEGENYKVQAFFEPSTDSDKFPLPKGCTYVNIPRNLLKAYGIERKEEDDNRI